MGFVKLSLRARQNRRQKCLRQRFPCALLPARIVVRRQQRNRRTGGEDRAQLVLTYGFSKQISHGKFASYYERVEKVL